nr:uncharacterized protein LOC111985806 [Quercus suber]
MDGFSSANQNLIQHIAGLPHPSIQSEAGFLPQRSFGATFASPQTPVQNFQPKCPISQVQCEQLLNYLKTVTASGSGVGTSAAHQVANVMASAPIIQPALPPNSASSSTTDASNFSGYSVS